MHNDTNDDWWVVDYTNFLAKTAELILQEKYGKYWLWAVCPHKIRVNRELELLPILGNQANVDEFFGMLILIERNHFDIISPTW